MRARTKPPTQTYRCMCRNDHEPIGYTRDDESCPLCEAKERIADMTEALKEWVDYFDRLDRDCEPNNPLREQRQRFHGKRMEKSRSALACVLGRGGESKS